ncbi:hypothetical protein SAMN04488527_12731 [Aliiroseovarius crassostreae]|nr:hypothetical protein SAMN04488527_12731 [Aliiroseovarius crassostreae]
MATASKTLGRFLSDRDQKLRRRTPVTSDLSCPMEETIFQPVSFLLVKGLRLRIKSVLRAIAGDVCHAYTRGKKATARNEFWCGWGVMVASACNGLRR